MSRELDQTAVEAAAEKLASYAAVCSEGNWFDWGENAASDIQYTRDTGEIIAAYQQAIAPAVREAVDDLVQAIYAEVLGTPTNINTYRENLLRLVGAQEGDDA